LYGIKDAARSVAQGGGACKVDADGMIGQGAARDKGAGRHHVDAVPEQGGG